MAAKEEIRLKFARRQPGFVATWCWILGVALAAAAPLLADGLPDDRKTEPSKKVSSAKDPAPANFQTATTDCSTCHSFDPMFSHPVDVSPTRRLPDLLPLQNGKLTCITCHDPDALEGHQNRPARDDPKLRGDIPVPSLCAQCHDSSEMGAVGSHASGLNIAHLAKGSRTPIAAAVSSSLDTESRGCLTCHDGTAAADAGLHTARLNSTFNAERDHPIGVPYKAQRAAHAAGDDVELVDVTRLDKKIRLFDGQVGCGSCHSVYSTQSKLLVLPMIRSQLCVSCHVE